MSGDRAKLGKSRWLYHLLALSLGGISAEVMWVYVTGYWKPVEHFFRTKKWTVNVTVCLVSVNAPLKYREGCKKNQVKQENFGFIWISSGQRRCCLLFQRVENANCLRIWIMNSIKSDAVLQMLCVEIRLDNHLYIPTYAHRLYKFMLFINVSLCVFNLCT
jgi:hypothetical protein